MVYSVTDFGKDFQQALDEFGTKSRIKFFTMSGTAFSSGTNADYDDAYPFVQSGTDLWASGVFYNLSGKQGSDDAILLERGQITINDSVIWYNGSITTAGSFTAIQVGIGSPVLREYSSISPGVDAISIGQDTYIKGVYLRFLPTGSLFGA